MGHKIWNFHIFLLIFVNFVFVNCVPTSVLVDSKETSSFSTGAKKVKRTPSTSSEQQEKVFDEKTSPGIGNLQSKYVPQKRGAPYQLYNSNTDAPLDFAINVPNGYWEDINTPVMYPDLSESDYQQEPLALPLQYTGFYGDRKKRSNNNKKNVMARTPSLAALRPKRQSNKISPAEILALMDLVNSQKQRSHYNGPGSEPSINLPYDFLLPQQQLQQPDDEGEWLDGWAEPAVEYYGLPMLDGGPASAYTDDSGLGPRYSFEYPNRFENVRNSHPSKRFMVSKKKRMNGARYHQNSGPQFQQQQPQYDPLLDNLALAYDYGRFGDVVDEPQKGHHKFF